MSDFLFSAAGRPVGQLAADLATIYLHDPAPSTEYHGPWGSLAVTRSRYRGFDALETDNHLCVVLGGPVLRFRDNTFLTDTDRQAGTRAILERWHAGRMDWSADLSGPFVVLLVDRSSGVVTCVTDLLRFIPVYRHVGTDDVVLGSHVDAVARTAARQGRFDEVSLADFILHYALTYPYTAYDGILQCQPATVHTVAVAERGAVPEFRQPNPYWRPVEQQAFATLDDAAHALREAVSGEIATVTETMDRVAQFLNDDEDSRALAGMLPARLQRDAYIFLDGMNREGRAAGRAAAAYGAAFRPDYRQPLHYLTILPEAAALIGSGHQYLHAHTLVFDRVHGLADYQAVFGGYAADALYKGGYARKDGLSSAHACMPQRAVPGELRSREVRSAVFPEQVLEEVTRRRREHVERVRELRPESAHEWFLLWPMATAAIPNLYCTRRLFASYEPYLASAGVHVAAGVPSVWKLNRRLFYRAFRPFLRRAPLTRTSDGRFPILPWWANFPVHFAATAFRMLERRFRRGGPHQGPWNDWDVILASDAWAEAMAQATEEARAVPVLRAAIEAGAFRDGGLELYQKVNLLQTCVQVGLSRRPSPEPAGASAPNP